MATLQAMFCRRSARRYTGEPVSEESLDEILWAGRHAPMGQDKRPCEFYVVRDRGTLEALSKAKRLGTGMLSGCDIAIAVLVDSEKADAWVEDCSIAMVYMSLMATDRGWGDCWYQMRLRTDLLGRDAEGNVRGILNVIDDTT